MREKTGSGTKLLKRLRNLALCHRPESGSEDTEVIALVGSPNVGKSAMFNNLTRMYVTVSNYPGTTVEVTTGKANIGGSDYAVVDTPGMYSVLSITEEERVARRLLLERKPCAVIQLVDAKNLGRMLQLTVQLMEFGFPLILCLNMMDEAEKLGLEIDIELLKEELGTEVVPTVCTTKKGMREVREAIESRPLPAPATPIRYEPDIEEALRRIEELLKADYGVSKRGIALLLLQNDAEIKEMVSSTEESFREIEAEVNKIRSRSTRSAVYRIAMVRQSFCRELTRRVITQKHTRKRSLNEVLSLLMISPWVGVPVVLLVLYLGLYKFVGQFGAGVAVDFIESHIFGQYVNPRVDSALHSLLPADNGWQFWLRELFGGEYGIITLGLTYAIAIILPIVFCFFVFFSILEDTGYFPRLAMMLDGLFKKLGLSGKAVIPMVLGLGCDTMATIVTRVLETKREKFIAILLLALAVPCSAQYGVIAGLLASRGGGLLGVSWAFGCWLLVVFGIFLVVGYLTSKILRGEKPTFYMELPPLRLPRIGNILSKTFGRMKWYFYEVLPLFVVASVLIWLGRLTRVFDLLIEVLSGVVTVAGLPAESAKAFIYGFFRRDFGAAGLYDLARVEGLTGVQLVVACVILTLFVPCIAQFLIMKKEQSLRVAVLVTILIITVAFSVGALLNAVLTGLGVHF